MRVDDLHAQPRGEANPMSVRIAILLGEPLPACPLVWLKQPLHLQVHRSEQLVVPEDIAARPLPLGHDQIDEAQRLRRLGVVPHIHADASLFLEVLQNGVGIDRVMRAVDDERLRIALLARRPRQPEARQHEGREHRQQH